MGTDNTQSQGGDVPQLRAYWGEEHETIDRRHLSDSMRRDSEHRREWRCIRRLVLAEDHPWSVFFGLPDVGLLLAARPALRLSGVSTDPNQGNWPPGSKSFAAPCGRETSRTQKAKQK